MYHAMNERVLRILSEYLCFTPCAVNREMVSSLAQELEISADAAYLAALAAMLGLETDQPQDGAIYRQYLPHMVHRLDPAPYRQDAYMQRVRPVPAVMGSIDLGYEEVQPMELFVADDFRMDAEGRLLPQLGWFPEAFRFPAIREEGRVWMTVTPNEINTIRPAIDRCRGRVLTYGLGLGYFAFHALLKEEVTHVTVVERSEDVIHIFREHLLPFFPRQDALEIVCTDAFDYAARVMPHQGFDLVFTDLWHDVEDGLPLYRRMKALECLGPEFMYWIEPTLRCYTD